jgi:hypothetical protein
MTPDSLPEPPPGLCDEARGFWTAVLATYCLEPWQMALLETATRALDMQVRCQTILDTEGLTISTGSGGMVRARPECTVLRDSRAGFIRACAALRLEVAE